MNLLKLTFYVGIANAILGVLALKKVLGTQPTNMLFNVREAPTAQLKHQIFWYDFFMPNPPPLLSHH